MSTMAREVAVPLLLFRMTFASAVTGRNISASGRSWAIRATISATVRVMHTVLAYIGEL